MYEEEEEMTPEEKKKKRSTDYKKIATAIGKMRQAGVQIVLPDINTSSYTFTPDVENNRIFFGLSGMLNVGEDVIADVIKNRPYDSIKDFYLEAQDGETIDHYLYIDDESEAKQILYDYSLEKRKNTIRIYDKLNHNIL